MTKFDEKEKKSHQIYDYLLTLIEENKYVPSYKLPSENALAQKFGSSRMCAQLALQKLAAKHLIIKERGSGCYINTEYILSAMSDSPMTEARIALVAPVGPSKFLTFIHNGFLSFFKELGVYPALYMCDSSEDEDRILKMLLHKKYDGIYFYPFNSEKCNPTLIELVNKSYPIVLIDRYYSDLDSYTVTSNHFASSYKIVEYIHKHQRERVCFITEPPIYSSIRQRYDGYYTALQHFPTLQKFNREIIYRNAKPEELTAKLAELFEDGSVDAIIANSGTVANLVISQAKKHNLEIGKDFLLALYDEEVSFDNIIDFSYVKLVQNSSEIGRTAAEILYKLLKKEPVEKKRYSIPTTLIEIKKQ